MNKAIRIIMNYYLEHDIGNIICGKLRESLCIFCGNQFVKQEESYTAQACFFDNDTIPVYNNDDPQEYSFSGR